MTSKDSLSTYLTTLSIASLPISFSAANTGIEANFINISGYDFLNKVISTFRVFLVINLRSYRALRSDHFTQQAIANVTGDTGRQRINPRKLLELRILVPPLELEEKIGRAVEQEFTLHALSIEQTNRVEDNLSKIASEQKIKDHRYILLPP